MGATSPGALGAGFYTGSKGQLLFTADNATARFNQMTPRQLAEHWAARMRAVLPTLTQPK